MTRIAHREGPTGHQTDDLSAKVPKCHPHREDAPQAQEPQIMGIGVIRDGGGPGEEAALVAEEAELDALPLTPQEEAERAEYMAHSTPEERRELLRLADAAWFKLPVAARRQGVAEVMAGRGGALGPSGGGDSLLQSPQPDQG